MMILWTLFCTVLPIGITITVVQVVRKRSSRVAKFLLPVLAFMLTCIISLILLAAGGVTWLGVSLWQESKDNKAHFAAIATKLPFTAETSTLVFGDRTASFEYSYYYWAILDSRPLDELRAGVESRFSATNVEWNATNTLISSHWLRGASRIPITGRCFSVTHKSKTSGECPKDIETHFGIGETAQGTLVTYYSSHEH